MPEVTLPQTKNIKLRENHLTQMLYIYSSTSTAVKKRNKESVPSHLDRVVARLARMQSGPGSNPG